MTTCLQPALHSLGPVTQIPPGEGREFSVGNTHIAVFRARNGNIYATQAGCPHQQGPLADGIVGGSILICPLHQWKFDLCSGEALVGTCRLDTYEVTVGDDGNLMLRWPALAVERL